MSLRDKILLDMKEAMKSKAAERLAVLRFLQSAIKNKEIEARPNELTEADVLSVITKQVKQRKESVEQFKAAGREDLSQKEEAELLILEEYLPKQLTREQIQKLVDEVVTSLGANSIKQMGAVIKEVMAKSAGAADGKVISEIVKSKLN